MDKLKRRDFLKLAGRAVIAPKMLTANNKTFITLLDIELLGGQHKLYKSGMVKGYLDSIRINDRPLSDYEDVVIGDHQHGLFGEPSSHNHYIKIPSSALAGS